METYQDMTPSPPCIRAEAHADLPRMLWAIACVENPKHDPNAIGPHGERGLWQMKEATWKDTTGWPWRYVTDPGISRMVTMAHLRELEYSLRAAGIDPTYFRIALAWKCGLSGAILRKFQPPEALSYAHRVEALALDIGGSGKP